MFAVKKVGTQKKSVHGLGTFSLVCSKKSKSTVFSYEAVYRPVHKKTVLLDLALKILDF